MTHQRALLILFLLGLMTGCDSQPEPAPPLNESTQSAIEEEDAAVHDLESQQ